jgi:DNA-binding Lrp family transcriptional regulator
LDRKDLDIMRTLLVSGRASYQTIGDAVGLSSNAAKARVMRMMKSGTIVRFVTNVKLEALGYDLIYVTITHAYDLDAKILKKVKLVGDTFMVINCVGGVTVLGIAVRGELEKKMELVKTLLEPAIVASISPVRASPVKRLTRTDLMLIRHLLKYPRATVNDIAKAIKISTRTVKRRFDVLTKNDVMHFMILFNPAAMKGYIHFSMMLEVDERKYRDVVRYIYKELSDSFLLPPPPMYQESTIVVLLYTDNVYSMDEMFKKVKNLDGVKNVELFVPSTLEFRQDWFVKVVEGLLKKTRETSIIHQEDYVLAR